MYKTELSVQLFLSDITSSHIMNGCNFITCLYNSSSGVISIKIWGQRGRVREHYFDDKKVKKWARSAPKIAIFVIFMLKSTKVYFNTFVIILEEELFFWGGWGMPHTMPPVQAIQHFDSMPFGQWRPVAPPLSASHPAF